MTDAPRKRRWPGYLAALLVLLALGAWWVNRQLEPDRLTALVLERAGTALGLELSIHGTPAYALRPEPRLVLPDFVARQPGAATPILRAERAEVSLPWDTITGGDSLVITRVELQQPMLDLAALAAWQATRPDAAFELPTLTEGLRIAEGRVIGDGWLVSGLTLSVPELRPGTGLRADATGRLEINTTRVDFAAAAHVASAGLASGLRLESNGRIASGELDAPFDLEWLGAFDATDDASLLVFDSLVVMSESPLPDLVANGRASLGAASTVALRGEIPRWPEGWPALPEPLAASESALAFVLDYEGAADFSAPLSLQLTRDQTELQSAFAVPALLIWLDSDRKNPLPPLEGSLTTPRLVVAGATLEGLRVEFDPEEPAAEEPAP
jgi:hypothetical protein